MIANPARVTLTPGCDGAANLEIDITMALDPTQWRSLFANVAGTPVPLVVSEDDGGAVARGEVPANVLRAGQPATIELGIDALRTAPGTTVQLGLALHEVRLVPVRASR